MSKQIKSLTKSPCWFETYKASKRQIDWEISSIFVALLENLNCTYADIL